MPRNATTHQFDGRLFHDRAFSKEELSKHRHMFKVVDENFRIIDDEQLRIIQDAATIQAAAKLVQGFPKMIAYVVGLVGASVSAGVWLASKGLL